MKIRIFQKIELIKYESKILYFKKINHFLFSGSLDGLDTSIPSGFQYLDKSRKWRRWIQQNRLVLP